MCPRERGQKRDAQQDQKAQAQADAAGAAIDAFLAFRAGRPTPAIADLKALIEDGRE